MLKFLRKSKLYILTIPILLAVLGTGLNQVAFNANHDAMPAIHNEVSVKEFYQPGFPVVEHDGTILTDARHSLLTSKSHLFLLCDIIDFDSEILSVGDVFLKASDALYPYIGYVWGVTLYASLRKREDELE